VCLTGPAAATAAAICWLAVPHLDLLRAEAHPTSLCRPPPGFTAACIGEGTQLFSQHCPV